MRSWHVLRHKDMSWGICLKTCVLRSKIAICLQDFIISCLETYWHVSRHSHVLRHVVLRHSFCLKTFLCLKACVLRHIFVSQDMNTCLETWSMCLETQPILRMLKVIMVQLSKYFISVGLCKCLHLYAIVDAIPFGMGHVVCLAIPHGHMTMWAFWMELFSGSIFMHLWATKHSSHKMWHLRVFYVFILNSKRLERLWKMFRTMA